MSTFGALSGIIIPTLVGYLTKDAVKNLIPFITRQKYSVNELIIAMNL